MKSFLRSGNETVAEMSVRYRREPLKKRSSVTTERAVAPPAS